MHPATGSITLPRDTTHAQSNQPMTPMLQAQKDLEERIDTIARGIDLLEQRLRPVLMDAAPPNSSTASTAPQLPPMSEQRAHLYEQHLRLNYVDYRINELMERLDL